MNIEVVKREGRYNTERFVDLLNAIMETAWQKNTAVKMRGGSQFGPSAGPWSLGGLRNILARRGYRLRTEDATEYAQTGPNHSVLVWCEVIRPVRPAKPKKTKLVYRRIRM